MSSFSNCAGNFFQHHQVTKLQGSEKILYRVTKGNMKIVSPYSTAKAFLQAQDNINFTQTRQPVELPPQTANIYKSLQTFGVLIYLYREIIFFTIEVLRRPLGNLTIWRVSVIGFWVVIHMFTCSYKTEGTMTSVTLLYGVHPLKTLGLIPGQSHSGSGDQTLTSDKEWGRCG